MRLLLAAALAASASHGGTGMKEQYRALSLVATQSGDTVELVLVGKSPQPVDVRYRVELTGDSMTRHAGATRITANEPMVLSRMRMSSGANWCATAHVEQGDGLEYTLREGNCG